MARQERIDLEVFQGVLGALGDATDLDMMATRVTRMLVTTLDIKASTLFLLNPTNGELERLKSSGLSMEYMNKGKVLSEQSFGRMMKGEPIVIEDTEQHTDLLQYPEAARREGLRAIVSLPISVCDRVIGALRVYHSEVWHLSDEALESLELLAQTLGLAMMFARLRQTILAMEEALSAVQGLCADP